MPRDFLFWIFFVVVSASVADTTTTHRAAAEHPPALLLANVYDDEVDLGNYWVSEKLDGVRAYWDGQQFISRGGNRFAAPPWFTEGFPDVPLDGELWMGRGTFSELSGAVRRHIPDEKQWRKIRYMVFDLPHSPASFDERLVDLRRLLDKASSPYIVAVKQFKVGSHGELQQRLQSVVDQGGEGLMLHRGSSLYRAGRSDDLLKVKTFDDAEAVVVAHVPGSGKYRGLLGSLLVETHNGHRFKIGTGFSDKDRANPPPVGSTVTYKYYGKTDSGIPRFASFLRIRAPE